VVFPRLWRSMADETQRTPEIAASFKEFLMNRYACLRAPTYLLSTAYRTIASAFLDFPA